MPSGRALRGPMSSLAAALLGCVQPSGSPVVIDAPPETLAVLRAPDARGGTRLEPFDPARPLFAYDSQFAVLELGVPLSELFGRRPTVEPIELVDELEPLSRPFPSGLRVHEPGLETTGDLPAWADRRRLPRFDLNACHADDGCADERLLPDGERLTICRRPCDAVTPEPPQAARAALPAPVRLSREADDTPCAPGQRAERAAIGGRTLTRCRPVVAPSSAPCGPEARATTDQRCEPLAACPTERWPAGVAAGTRFVEVGATGGDGSATRPWGRVSDAVGSGAGPIMVRGRVDEDLVLRGPLAVHGVCPGAASVARRVRIEGEVSLSGLAMEAGVLLADDARLALAEGSVHAATGPAVGGGARTTFSATDARLSGSRAIFALGAGPTVTLERTELRGPGASLGKLESARLSATGVVFAGVGGAWAVRSIVSLVDTAWLDIPGQLWRVETSTLAAEGLQAARVNATRPTLFEITDSVVSLRRAALAVEAGTPMRIERAALDLQGVTIEVASSVAPAIDAIDARGTFADVDLRARTALQWSVGSLRVERGVLEGTALSAGAVVALRDTATLLRDTVIVGPGKRGLAALGGTLSVEDVLAVVEDAQVEVTVDADAEPGSPTSIDRASVVLLTEHAQRLRARRLELQGGFYGLRMTNLQALDLADTDVGYSPVHGREPEQTAARGVFGDLRRAFVRRLRVHDRWQGGVDCSVDAREVGALDVEDLSVDGIERLALSVFDPCNDDWALGVDMRAPTGTMRRISVRGLPGRAVRLSATATAAVPLLLEDLEVRASSCRALDVRGLQHARIVRATVTSSLSGQVQIISGDHALLELEDLDYDVPNGFFVYRADNVSRFTVDRWLLRSARGLIDLGDEGTVGHRGPAVEPRVFRDGAARGLLAGVSNALEYCPRLSGERILLRARLPAGVLPLWTCR